MSFFSRLAIPFKSRSRRRLGVPPGARHDEEGPGAERRLGAPPTGAQHNEEGLAADRPLVADRSAAQPTQPETNFAVFSANLTGLPPNAFSLIIAHLDEASLFDLGRACRSLNSVVFGSWFDGHAEYDLRSSRIRCLSAAVNAPLGLLTAVRCYLDFPAITQLAYGVQPGGGLRDVVQQLTDLASIVRRQSAVDSAMIFLSQVDRRIAMAGRESFVEGYAFTQENWRMVVTALADLLLTKGCTYLVIRDGDNVLQCLDAPSSNGDSSEASLRLEPGPPETAVRTPHTLNVAPSALSPGPPLEAVQVPPTEPGAEVHPIHLTGPPTQQRTSLQTFYLRSDMLLTPLFYNWTVSAFRFSSLTLTTLKIECSRTPSATWAALLSSINIALLRELEMVTSPLLVDRQLDIHPDDLARFLARHQTIEKLSFYGVMPGTPSPDVLRTLKMPALKSFTAHPIYVLWLLDLPKSHVPHLSTVVVSTEYITAGLGMQPPYAVFDDVLNRLVATQQTITLGFRFKPTTGLYQWLQDRANSSHTLIRSLSSITNVYIQFSWYMKFSDERCRLIADFVGAFPSVENLVLEEFLLENGPGPVDWPAEYKRKLQTFFEKRCPKLRTLRVNGKFTLKLTPSVGPPDQRIGRPVEPGPPE